MKWLLLSYWLTVGSLFQQDWAVSDQPGFYETPGVAIETELGMNARVLDHLNVGGFIRTDSSPAAPPFFAPFLSTYGVDINVEWGPFRAGFRHSCTHPVVSDAHSLDSYLMENRTSFYLTFSGKAGQ